MWIRPLVFMIVLCAMLVAQRLKPKREASGSRQRYVANGGIFCIGILVVQLIEPIAVVAASIFAQKHNFGLFNILEWHTVIEYLICIVLLDLAIYFQHVATHKVPMLWSLHRVHHYDTEVDVSTALRFHPVEIVLSMIYKSLCVVLLGVPLVAVVIFEVLLNALAMFNHANLGLPRSFDRILRRLVVTPDMHVVHHSQVISDSDSNFGFGLSCWDRIFKTYVGKPEAGFQNLNIGQAEVSQKQAVSLRGLLSSPFKR